MNEVLIEKIITAVDQFCDWLGRYGEISYDHQSFFASKLGRGAKALYYRRPLFGTVAVAPMVFFEAFVPSVRTFFWKPQRFPIADADYAMGFALLAGIYGPDKYYQRAVHFLGRLKVLIRLARRTLHLEIRDICRNEDLQIADSNRHLQLFADECRNEPSHIHVELRCLAFDRTGEFFRQLYGDYAHGMSFALHGHIARVNGLSDTCTLTRENASTA